MKFEKLETIRVRFEDGYYVDIVPAADYDNVRDYFLKKEGYGTVVFMFGVEVDSDEKAVEIAEANVDEYIADLYVDELDDDDFGECPLNI